MDSLNSTAIIENYSQRKKQFWNYQLKTWDCIRDSLTSQHLFKLSHVACDENTFFFCTTHICVVQKESFSTHVIFYFAFEIFKTSLLKVSSSHIRNLSNRSLLMIYISSEKNVLHTLDVWSKIELNENIYMFFMLHHWKLFKREIHE